MSQRTPHGFSILSTIVAIGIFGLLITVIANLQLTIFNQNKISEARSENDQRFILLLRNFTREVRSAQYSHQGGYPIDQATDTTFTFYTDLQSNGVIERVRYFVDTGTLKKGVTIPTGQPLTYNPAQEQVSTLIQNITGTGPFFRYYDESYDGVINTQSMPQPVDLQDIRMTSISLTVDAGRPNVQPSSLSTNVTIRNLKAN